ncbi:hypothetical protein ACFLWA_09180 [Chloroflexota bacterium]
MIGPAIGATAGAFRDKLGDHGIDGAAETSEPGHSPLLQDCDDVSPDQVLDKVQRSKPAVRSWSPSAAEAA